MKVAIYNGRIPATTFIERLIEGLAEAGVEVLLFGKVAGVVKYEHPNVHVYGWKGRLERWGLCFRYLSLLLLLRPKKVIALWKNFPPQNFRIKLYKFSQFLPVLWHQPDVFHIQWAKSLKDWFWVRDFGMRLVVSLRGGQINYAPIAEVSTAKLYRALFPKVDGFHAVSKAISAEAQRYGATSKRIRIVYSGLEIQKFPFHPNRLEKDKLHILSVGRVHWKKGYVYALDACRLLQGKIDFHYTVIGGFCVEHAFHVYQMELGEYITLTERMSFDEVRRYMLEADVLLLPSVEEGIANVVLEAMALGTPVISTNCGGMAEVIEDGLNGLLVPVRDARAIAKAILRFNAMTPEERMSMAQTARQTIEQHFRVEQMVAGMVELYRSTDFAD